jgi:CspA family cold shock protein
MIMGTVRLFNELQGFGVIAPDTGINDVLVHVSALERAGIRKLERGQRVLFKMRADRHGQAAAHQIQLVARTASASAASRPDFS